MFLFIGIPSGFDYSMEWLNCWRISNC